jgi:hypothetical protein
MTDDLDLLRDYAAHGSDDAFRTLLNRYVGLVYAAALRQVQNPHLAEEITQAVFLVLARKAGALRSGTVLAGWLFRTTRFLAARAIRDQQRRQRHEEEAARMKTTLLFVKAAMKSILYAKLWTTGAASVTILAVAGVGTLLAQKIGGEKGMVLPTQAGQSVVIELPGLPAGAKKLEFVLVPGRGEVRPFLLGKYELTQGQYEALMHTNPSTFSKGPDYPVEQMSWQDAKDFCAKLTASQPASAKVSFALPTDEEWSIAVGLPEEVPGTLKQKSNKIRGVYPWGTNWPPPNTAGNYSDASNRKKYGTQMSYVPKLDDGFEDTSPVGSFPPNEFGLYDMGGNVWEWCEDFVDERRKVHVVRGAGWFTHSESQLLSAYRGIPPTRNFASGFRVKLEGNAP